MRILWCITGAGHLLKESVEFMEKISSEHDITIAMSNAGLEVAGMYRLNERIKKIASKLILEKDQGTSFPFIGRLSQKKFDKIFVMPCSANTTAKIAHGIADSLVTNIVAQGLKNQISVLIFPTDFRKTERTKTPDGLEITVHMRDVDIENARKISEMGIKVVKNFKEIKI